MAVLENAHALIVGIANYAHVARLPKNVLYDARDVRDALVDPAGSAYPRENVHLLLDGQATATGLRQALAGLAARTNDDSIVTIYLSSHGGRIEGGPHAGEYIIPVDARYDPEEPAALANTAISGDEFSQALRAIPARRVLVILDCCHAGGIGQPKSALAPQEAALVKGFSEELYEELRQGRGRVILASARSDEESYILPGDRNSLFTKHLLAGLGGAAEGDDEFVRVFQLYEYVQPRVTAEQPRQHPRFKSDMEENFPVGFYRGGQKRVAPTPPETEDAFAYDVYISYTDREPDAAWVWDTFIPQVEAAGISPERIAVAGEVERPGVTLLLEAERALSRSKRVLLVLSNQYFDDPRAKFDFQLTQHLQVKREEYRLLPVIISPDLDRSRIPERLDMYGPVDITHPRRGPQRLARVIQSLKEPLPGRNGG